MTHPNIWLVCGSRYLEEWILTDTVEEHLDRLVEAFGRPEAVVQGEARGADRIAKLWARDNDINCYGYPANWKKYGKGAGFIRNGAMLEAILPDGGFVAKTVDNPRPMCIAFPMLCMRSAGTWDMLTRAAKVGVPTLVLSV